MYVRLYEMVCVYHGLRKGLGNSEGTQIDIHTHPNEYAQTHAFVSTCYMRECTRGYTYLSRYIYTYGVRNGLCEFVCTCPRNGLDKGVPISMAISIYHVDTGVYVLLAHVFDCLGMSARKCVRPYPRA